MSALAGKHIILGITGGIAAYKSAVLLRLLIKAGAEVQVVITPNGKQFITPVTLSALSGKPVISEFFTANTGEWHSHVDLGLWADAMVIAPATASSIGKMANGVADNMLITTYLSSKCPVFVAPAMDLDMMAHPSTTRNLELLRNYGNHIIEPAEGELASHLVGKGRMEEPEKIAAVLEAYFACPQPLKGLKAMVTAGPTYERIDPVRFIGNFSTGKMGYAIAESLRRQGADVVLVSGPTALPDPAGIRTVRVESACQMLEACRNEFDSCDIAVWTAAVADYAPAHPADSKIKREKAQFDSIDLVMNPDIAATFGKCRRDGQTLVGFALETDHGPENAARKLKAKNLDIVVLNSLSDPGAGFGTDTNKITIFDHLGHSAVFGLKSKAEVADDIVNYIAEYRSK